MRHSLFTVRDQTAEYYMPPFTAVNKGTAIRSVNEAARDQNSNIGKYPNQFALFEVGVYDDATGVIEACAPVLIGLVSDLMVVKDG